MLFLATFSPGVGEAPKYVVASGWTAAFSKVVDYLMERYSVDAIDVDEMLYSFELVSTTTTLI